MSQEVYTQYSLNVNIALEIAGADVNQARQHKVVSIDQKLDEKLRILLLNVEMI